MKEILLTRGKVALVDDEDYEELSKYKWCYTPGSSRGGYAVRSIQVGHGAKTRKTKSIWMHRQIMNTPAGMQTDHINFDKLDNRRSNLRIVTHRQNAQHQPTLISRNKSGHRGVYWFELRKKWKAQIVVDGKNIHLGLFDDINEAARTYKIAAKIHFGELYQG